MAKKTKKPANSLNFTNTLNLEDSIKPETKVSFIKEEIAAGRYEIHSDRIAAKMLEHVVMTKEEAELV